MLVPYFAGIIFNTFVLNEIDTKKTLCYHPTFQDKASCFVNMKRSYEIFNIFFYGGKYVDSNSGSYLIPQKGLLRLELNEKVAPKTCENFVELAKKHIMIIQLFIALFPIL